MVPFFGVRFGLLSVLGKEAVHRAAHFAPMYGKEQVAYFVYQLATAAVVVYPAFLTVKPGLTWHFLLGLLCGGLGLILCIASMGAFARPDDREMCAGGVYRLSRNPMYLGSFYVFCRLCPDDGFAGTDGGGAHISGSRPLDCSGRRTLVPGTLWRKLPLLYEAGAQISIIGWN